jgi:hypothetical protein
MLILGTKVPESISSFHLNSYLSHGSGCEECYFLECGNMLSGRRLPVLQRNGDKLLPGYMVSHPKTQYSSNSYVLISENSISLNFLQNVSIKGTETLFVTTFLKHETFS